MTAPRRPGRPGPSRRAVIAAGPAAAFAALGGCGRASDAPYAGGWVGAGVDRGHLLRTGLAATKSGALPEAAVVHRVGVVIVGAGIAGLAAARALLRAGIDDVHVLELEDEAGGNSRGHVMAGMRCPLGAHYLPVPGEKAVEVVELLEALGVRKTVAGRAEYDERALCQSPQERLFIGGGWRDGLLPPIEALPRAEQAPTLRQYRAFAAAIAEAGGKETFTIPSARGRWTPGLAGLDAITFAAWLDGRGLVAPALRWYLDYCCLDDYGAGSTHVSAWAGIHYFASRHGFHAPGSDDGGAGVANDGVLTWPEGNAWLARRLAAPLGERLWPGRIVLGIDEGRDGVRVDAWNAASKKREVWMAARAIIATPLFIAARLLAAPPPALLAAAAELRHAPWLVGNLQLEAALDDRPGAPLSWDNVVYGGKGLGYVDAMHQSTRPFAGPTVLTAYQALGGADLAALTANRKSLLDDGWRVWSDRLIADLEVAHPDLRAKLQRLDLMRYGHAMAIPSPGVRSSAALAALTEAEGRVQFAHADLSAYSIFEEALWHGNRAGRVAAAQMAS